MRNRNNAFIIRLYDDELQILNKKAKKAGMAREQFVRDAIFNKKIHELPPIDFTKLIFEVRRVGQNLNRLLQIAYSNGFLDVSSIRICLDEIRSLDKEIHSEFFSRGTEK